MRRPLVDTAAAVCCEGPAGRGGGSDRPVPRVKEQATPMKGLRMALMSELEPARLPIRSVYFHRCHGIRAVKSIEQSFVNRGRRRPGWVCVPHPDCDRIRQ